MITENGMTPADVAAVVGNNRGYGYGGVPFVGVPYGGYGGYGDGFGGSWLIVFLALMMFGGFGGGWGMNGGMGGYGMFPWLMAGQNQLGQQMNGGFDNAAVMGQLGGIQNAITDGFGRQEIAACGRAMDSMQTAYNNQIASMNQNFAAQTAVDGRLDSLAMALQQCCCDNRLATESLRATILQENCTDRYEAAQNTRDIIENANRNNQAIIDKLCQLELDGYKREADQLRSQLQFANMQASQVAQTAEIRANNATVANQLISELRSCPIPAQPVYGSQPIFTCSPNNNGCGCGNGFAN